MWSWILSYRGWIILILNKNQHRIFVLLYTPSTKQNLGWILTRQSKFHWQHNFPFFQKKFNYNIFKDNTQNACTQVVIRVFTAKYEILQLYPNGHSFFFLFFFYSEIQNSTVLLKRLFVFHSEKRNLELYALWQVIPKRSFSFFQQINKSKVASKFPFVFIWPQDKKSEVVLKRSFVFWLQTTKIELNYLLFQWTFNNSKKPDKTIR